MERCETEPEHRTASPGTVRIKTCAYNFHLTIEFGVCIVGR